MEHATKLSVLLIFILSYTLAYPREYNNIPERGQCYSREVDTFKVEDKIVPVVNIVKVLSINADTGRVMVILSDVEDYGSTREWSHRHVLTFKELEEFYLLVECPV